MTTVTADDTGAADADFTVPAGTAVGDHVVAVMSARGTSSAAALTVTAPQVRRGYVIASPLVRPGGRAAVILYGWSPNTPLTLTLDGTTALAAATTDQYGNAIVAVTIPVGTSAGVHRVIATAGDGTASASTVFVLRR